MDSQCDKCGKELPKFERYEDEPEVIHTFHITMGDHELEDFEPMDEYDFCQECKQEFLKLWKGWYGA